VGRHGVGALSAASRGAQLEGMTADLAAAFLERARYYLGTEYPAKIRPAVRALPPGALWHRANPQANSAGNLVLHLAGNVRQWIVSGIGGAPDVRHRDAEFAATAASGLDAEAVLATLDAALADAVAVLARVDPATLMERRLIQGRDTTAFAAIFHCVEHFSGHTGQLILMAKQAVPGAVKYYDDAGGLAKPLFLPEGMTDAAD
jgi:uncharacterized damage-inducible protein DinB